MKATFFYPFSHFWALKWNQGQKKVISILMSKSEKMDKIRSLSIHNIYLIKDKCCLVFTFVPFLPRFCYQGLKFWPNLAVSPIEHMEIFSNPFFYIVLDVNKLTKHACRLAQTIFQSKFGSLSVCIIFVLGSSSSWWNHGLTVV